MPSSLKSALPPRMKTPTPSTEHAPQASPQLAKKNLIRQFFNSRPGVRPPHIPPPPPAPTPSALPVAIPAPPVQQLASAQPAEPVPQLERTSLPSSAPSAAVQEAVALHEPPTPTSPLFGGPEPNLPIPPSNFSMSVQDATPPSASSPFAAAVAASAGTPSSPFVSPPRSSVSSAAQPPPQPPSSPVQRLLNRYPLNETFLAKYTITAELGSGGFGHVLAAVRESDGKEVAVKLIYKKRIPVHAWARDADLGVMPMEVYLVKRCNHPNIVGYEDFFECERFAYLIMEMHGTQWSVEGHPYMKESTDQDRAAAGRDAAVENASRAVSKLSVDVAPSHAVTPDSPPPSPTNRLLNRVIEEEPSVISNGASIASNAKTQQQPPQLRSRQNSHPPSGIQQQQQPPNPSLLAPRPPPLVRAQSFPAILTRKPSMDLFEHIEAHSHLPERHARRIFIQITSALSYLHSHGIVHRDLKDENIVIDANLDVKLIDFGSAAFETVHNKKASFDRFQGTLHYASPEILAGKKYRGKPSDIWALGVLLYTMLFGECPFRNSDEACDGPYKRPRVDVSRSCLRLVDWMLEKDPTRRPTAEEVLEHTWTQRAGRGRTSSGSGSQSSV
ncbi:hypothetical protein HKX48_008381 [Thoreauomyces humboldtii]|nr:hypothetical protein HKX48_008381 [Thoreauomyces humboldtii]